MMDYNIQKICRVCLEEGANTSIFSTDFAIMAPCTMLMICAKVRIEKSDGLPSVICDKCLYRLGAAYHFKQECENSDVRLRQYLGIPDSGYGLCNAETNTETNGNCRTFSQDAEQLNHSDEEEPEEFKQCIEIKNKKKRSRYKCKPPEEQKKRGPKPSPKLPQTCYECNKTFKCAAQLQLHLRTHTGEKPFACQFCDSRFTQRYNLQIHERTHTGEKPFQCEICSKQFSALGNFQAHQKIHTGIRDQLCHVCQKAFYTAGDLSKHMTVHTGIKNHHCDICGKSFSRLRDIKTHKRKLHVRPLETDEDTDETVAVGSVIDENFKCPDCDEEFTTASALSLHFRSHSNSANGGGGVGSSSNSSNSSINSNSSLFNMPLNSHMMHPPPTLATHTHETLYQHAHHFTLSGPIQPSPTMGMAIAHPSMAHMQPPNAPHTAHSSHYTTQRLHPY